MQKVYLLLRSNQQSGPHSLDELIAFNLRPSDLIWIEGKSAGWYYPQEIKALHPHLSFLKTKPETPTQAVANLTSTNASSATGKKVFVAMLTAAKPPVAENSTKPLVDAEMFSLNSAPADINDEPELKTVYSQTLEQTETSYMNWMYEKRKQQSSFQPRKAALAACLLGVAALGAWWLTKPVKDATTEPVAAQPFSPTVEVQEEAPTVTNDAGVTTMVLPSSSKKQTINTDATSRQKIKQSSVSNPSKTEVTTTQYPSEKIEQTAPPLQEEPSTADNTATEPVTTEAPKEKKKLREKILDLFKKNPEEAKPAETEEGNRQSTRRESGANLVQMVTVRLTTPNDWMMGIKGARATLTNRSSETIGVATVEIVYYNDDNEVLARRSILFHNIKSKNTAVVAIPDHATATRVEYNVLSATRAGEPLASR